MYPSVSRWTRSRMRSTTRGVNAVVNSPRRRVWSGGSIWSIQPS